MRKLLVFILIIFLTPNVFATTYDISNKTRTSPTGTQGRYFGTEIGNTGTENTYSINTRYTGTLSRIRFYISSNDFDWDYNKTYTVTMNMATEDWRNHFMGPQVFSVNSDGSIPSSSHNMYVSGTFKFVSMKKIKFDIKIPSTMNTYIYFNIYSTSVSSTAFTGVSNWNLSSITISTITNPTPTPVPVTPVPSTPTPTPHPDNSDIINNANQNANNIINNANQNANNIINNANQNTNDVINNASQNTSDIIDNANQNASDIIDSSNQNADNTQSTIKDNLDSSLMNCDKLYAYRLSMGNKITSTGTIAPDDTSYYTPDYIGCDYSSKITISNAPLMTSGGAYGIIAFYDSNKNFLSYYSIYNRSITLPTGTKYFRLSTTKKDIYIYNGNGCTSKLDETTNAVNDLNNSINNDNISPGAGSDFFDDFNNNMHGLSGIITIPLSYIQSLSSAQCSPLHIPIPFTNNKYLDLPCMTTVYQQHVPTLLTLIQTCWYGILAYKVLIDIFGIVKGFKDPDSDKIEVMDL